MSTEKEKSLRGELYSALDPQLVEERRYCRLLLQKYSITGPDDIRLRKEILHDLFGHHGKDLEIEPPFFCDYGSNITLGDKVYLNFNCVILDVTTVDIGEGVLIGPNVQIYTATHPLDWKLRKEGLENAKPVFIGSHVWIGGGSIILPGVKIGDRSVIGAGSVVTKDIPPDVLAVGNPCRVIRYLGKKPETSFI
jgi:maltose O-acetyltransferase